MGLPAYCPPGGSADTLDDVSHTETLLWIVALFVLEVNHLKWIWWTQWSCRGCGDRNEHCDCGRSKKWLMYL